MLILSRLLFLCALLISGWLAAESVTASVGCSAGGDCSAVVTSQWAKVLGVPIALVGVLTYLAVLVIGFCRPHQDRTVATISATLCFLIIGSALWFTGLQAVIIKSFCPYCCVIHALATVGALLTLVGLYKNHATDRPLSPILPMVVSGLLVTALVMIQFLGPQSSQTLVTTTDAHKHGAEEAPLLFTTDPFMLVGGATAPSQRLSTITIGEESDTTVRLAMLSDWTCEYCRALYNKLSEVKAPEGVQYQITVLPTYSQPEAKALQESLMRLRASFPSIYDIVYTELIHGVLDPTSTEIKARMDALDYTSHSPERIVTDQEISEALEIAQAQRKYNEETLHLETVPQLFSATAALTGNPTMQELQQFLQNAIPDQK